MREREKQRETEREREQKTGGNENKKHDIGWTTFTLLRLGHIEN